MPKNKKKRDLTFLYASVCLFVGMIGGIFFSPENQPKSDPKLTNINLTQSVSPGSWDIDKNGLTNIHDLGMVIDSFGKNPSSKPGLDINKDGIIDIVDIGIVIDHYSF